MSDSRTFEAGDFVSYPTHGVGRIQKIGEQEIAGLKIKCFVIAFEKQKFILRVPVIKAMSLGMRKLASPKTASGSSLREGTTWRAVTTSQSASDVV